VRAVGAAPVTAPARISSESFAAACLPELSLLGCLSPKLRALCAKEITLQLAARIPRSLLQRIAYLNSFR
jgi:hypothetical protein